eukprot:COSAG01_NODE_8160_length_2897_cov_5.436741_3_plen_56_part_00
MENLAARPEMAPVLLECATKMLRWRMRHCDHQLTHIALGLGGAKPRFATLHEAKL